MPRRSARTEPGLVAAALAALLLLAGAPPPASGQHPSVYTPAGHWSVDAARRLHAMGLMPGGYDPAPTVQSVAELRAAFAAAADRSPLARAYRDRLTAELGDLGAPAEAGGPRLRSAGGVRVGALREAGRVRIGFGNLNGPDWTGPLPQPDRTSPVLGADVHLERGRVAAAADVYATPDSVVVAAGYAVAAVGPFAFTGGVRPVALRTSPYAGIVLTDVPPLPAVGVRLHRAVRLPWVLESLGPVRLESFVARGRQNFTFEHPWIWGLRFMVAPHPRLSLGLNRAVMLAGEGNTPLTLRSLAYLLIGKHSGEEGEFDNQVVAVTVRYRPPVPGLPLFTYLEWGFDDSAGAWKDVPAILAGLELPSVPGAPALALGVSGTWFDAACCGNTMWYRNWSFRGGWADAGEPLGHPLGGHGEEYRLYGRADALDARLQLRPSVVLRRRGEENLLAPQREGRSWGGELEVVGLAGAWQGFVRAAAELGGAGVDDWTRTALTVGVRGGF